jgi:phage protein D/phage baseplate assembly protein gpV
MAVPVATLKSGTQPFQLANVLMELEIHRELNKVPEAKLTLLDGSVPLRQFELSDGGFFEPGKVISIALRYEGEQGDLGRDQTVFQGLVVRHAVENAAEGSTLKLELKGLAFKLTRQRKSAVFRKASDGEAIKKVVTDAQVDLVTDISEPPGAIKHDELIQYDASAWDFIVSRADVAGMVVDAHLNRVAVKPMAVKGAVRDLEFGKEVSDFSLEIDAGHQWASVEGVGWDLPKHAAGDPQKAADPSPAIKAGQLDPAAVAPLVGGARDTLMHPAALPPAEIKAWASARLARSRLSFLRGHVTVDGDAKYAPHDVANLKGIGANFNGQALISGVTHKLSHEGWRTELQIGLPPDWFARQPDIADVPAGGMLPPVRTLQIAKVAPFEADPLGEHRIKVELPAIDKSKQGVVWARMAHPDAGKDRGFVFWPEAGDEVVVGFLNDDPRQAIVLGALHGKLSLPDNLAPTDTNDMRVLVSRSGSFLRFDDKTKQIVLSTPSGHTVKLDDEGKTLVLSHASGSNITMDDKGITIETGGDLKISADGKVEIKGTAVDVQ